MLKIRYFKEISKDKIIVNFILDKNVIKQNVLQQFETSIANLDLSYKKKIQLKSSLSNILDESELLNPESIICGAIISLSVSLSLNEPGSSTLENISPYGFEKQGITEVMINPKEDKDAKESITTVTPNLETKQAIKPVKIKAAKTIHSSKRDFDGVNHYFTRETEGPDSCHFLVWVFCTFISDILYNFFKGYCQQYSNSSDECKLLFEFCTKNKLIINTCFTTISKLIVEKLIASTYFDIERLSYSYLHDHKTYGKRTTLGKIKIPYALKSEIFKNTLKTKYFILPQIVHPKNEYSLFEENLIKGDYATIYKTYVFRNIHFKSPTIKNCLIISVNNLFIIKRAASVRFKKNGLTINFFCQKIPHFKTKTDIKIINRVSTLFEKYKIWNFVENRIKNNLNSTMEFFCRNKVNLYTYFFDYRARYYIFLSQTAKYNFENEKGVVGFIRPKDLSNFSFYNNKYSRVFITLDFNETIKLTKNDLIYISLLIQEIKCKLLDPKRQKPSSILSSKTKWTDWLKYNFISFGIEKNFKSQKSEVFSKWINTKLRQEVNHIFDSFYKYQSKTLVKKELIWLLTLGKIDAILKHNYDSPFFGDLKACCMIVAAAMVDCKNLRRFSGLTVKENFYNLSPATDPYIRLGDFIYDKILPKLLDNCKPESVVYINSLFNRKLIKFLVFSILIGRNTATLLSVYEKEHGKVDNAHKTAFIFLIKCFNDEIKSIYGSYFVIIDVIKTAIQKHFYSHQGPFIFKLKDVELRIESLPLTFSHTLFFNKCHIKIYGKNGQFFRVTPAYHLSDNVATQLTGICGKKIHKNKLQFVNSMVQHLIDGLLARHIISSFNERDIPSISIHDAIIVRISQVPILNGYTREFLIDINKEMSRETRRLVKKYDISKKDVKNLDIYYENITCSYNSYTKKVIKSEGLINLFNLLLFLNKTFFVNDIIFDYMSFLTALAESVNATGLSLWCKFKSCKQYNFRFLNQNLLLKSNLLWITNIRSKNIKKHKNPIFKL